MSDKNKLLQTAVKIQKSSQGVELCNLETKQKKKYVKPMLTIINLDKDKPKERH